MSNFKYFTIEPIEIPDEGYQVDCSLVATGVPYAVSLEYRFIYDQNNEENGASEWLSYAVSQPITNDRPDWFAIQFRNTTSQFSQSATKYYKFTSTKNFKVSGRISTLYNYNNEGDLGSILSYSFCSLFDGCTTLIDASELKMNILNVSTYCCYKMFNGCTNLLVAPELPAENIADYCYSNMFKGCSKLTAVPDLPALVLKPYCYQAMFDTCRALTEIKELPATELKKNCYHQMFTNCSGLTIVPELPATTLAEQCCTSMFANCSKLREFPKFKATIMATNCFQSFVQNCGGLSSAVIDLTHVTQLASGCFSGMTQYTKYKEIHLPNCTYIAGAFNSICAWGGGGDVYWPYAEIPTKLFNSIYVKNKTFYYSNSNLDVLSIPRDTTGIPADWSIVYIGPEPGLVFSINGKSVKTLLINGKAVAKLG